MSFSAIEDLQKEFVKSRGQSFFPPPTTSKSVAANVREGIIPINGFRRPPEGDTTGWYIYAGEKLRVAALTVTRCQLSGKWLLRRRPLVLHLCLCVVHMDAMIVHIDILLRGSHSYGHKRIDFHP